MDIHEQSVLPHVRRVSIPNHTDFISVDGIQEENDMQIKEKSETEDEAANFSFSKVSREKKFLLLCMGFVNFCAMTCFSLLAPFFPKEAESKGASQTIVGMVFGIFELLIFITAPIYGNFITIIGSKFMFISGILVCGVCAILFGILDKSPDGDIFIIMCFLSRSVEALGASALFTASFAIVSHEFPNHVAIVIGSLETFSGIGLMVGPTIGSALYEAGGYGLPFFVMGGVVMVCGFTCSLVMPKIDVVFYVICLDQSRVLPDLTVLELQSTKLQISIPPRDLRRPSNIPEAPAYGVYISQLIRYARACSSYDDFVNRGRSLTAKLMTQGYTKNKLKIYDTHKPFPGSVLSLLKSPLCLVTAVSIISGSFSLVFLDPTLANHLSMLHLSQIAIGLMFLLAPGAYAFTTPVIGWIGDRKKIHKLLIIGGNLVTAVAFLLIGPSPLVPFYPYEIWSIVLALLIMGVFVGFALVPAFQSLFDGARLLGMEESFYTYGMVSGMFNSCFSLGAFLGPTVGGILVDQYDFATACSICSLLYLLAGSMMATYCIIEKCTDCIPPLPSKSGYEELSGSNSISETTDLVVKT